MILFIKNIDIEGPETLGPFFEKDGFPMRTIDLSNGDKIPADLSDLDAVVVLGGPMNVYEEDKYSYLRDEDVFIKKVLKERISYLGLCLGAQLLAKAAGAKVGKSPKKEIGFDTVLLTNEGKADPLFFGLSGELDVFQWHEDMFEIPSSGTLLSSSSGCPHQAMRVGSNAYGLQFHIEITDKSIHEWSDEYFQHDPELLRRQKQAMLKRYEIIKTKFHKTAENLFANFVQIIRCNNKKAASVQKIS
jgi:GMP synthase-like glutamine amidotransferase